MTSTTFRLIAVATIAMAAILTAGQKCDAQLLSKIRSEYGKDSVLNYGPADPSFRSRLFNLHTGQSGAYYNCDGEENKRNSPYIKWKTVRGASFPPLFWDIRQWKADRAEIAQRICDGGCCNPSAKKGGLLKKRSRCSCCETCDSNPTGDTLVASNGQHAPNVPATQMVDPLPAKSKTGLLASFRKGHSVLAQKAAPSPAKVKPIERTAGLLRVDKTR